MENAFLKVTLGVDMISEALCASSQAKSDAASIMLEFEITRRMSLPECSMNFELRTLKKKALKLHFERKNEDEHRDIQVATASKPYMDPF